ncbi:MAG: hypothetical protein ACRD5W_04045 [Candidatus Acidiferrales bacterium]
MLTKSQRYASIRLADECWIVTALLHRDFPDHSDFTISEIVQRAEREMVSGEVRAGFRPHVTLHCVANLPPNPGKQRMLFATGKHTRRLYRPGDDYHPQREGSDECPAREDVPEEYRDLLDWYTEYCNTPAQRAPDAFLELFGSGRELWANEKPADYVRRIREGFE